MAGGNSAARLSEAKESSMIPDFESIRNDFPMLRCGDGSIYLDNSATSYKPDCVIDAISRYYRERCASSGRGNYRKALQVDEELAQTREAVARFIGGSSPEEIVFTHGATDGLNLVAVGYGERNLNPGDVVLTTRAEHASCILPWMRACKKTGAKLEYIPLDKDGRVDLKALAELIDERVKVIVVAHISNVLGYVVPIRQICDLAHSVGAVVAVDGAQSVGHITVDVEEMGCDFLAFSAHKMCGPTGIGILFSTSKLMHEMSPKELGGGSNINYSESGEIFLCNPPYLFESGTLPLAEIFGLRACLDYLQGIGIDNIEKRIKELHAHAIASLSDINHIQVFNTDDETGIITFNAQSVFADDLAQFFDSRGICVRAGQHCSRLLAEQLGSISTVRASIYFYNSHDEIDCFAKTCSQATNRNVYDYIFSSERI